MRKWPIETKGGSQRQSDLGGATHACRKDTKQRGQSRRVSLIPSGSLHGVSVGLKKVGVLGLTPVLSARSRLGLRQCCRSDCRTPGGLKDTSYCP